MESDIAYLRRVYAPRCAQCRALLDYRRYVHLDADYRGICDACAQPRERTAGEKITERKTK